LGPGTADAIASRYRNACGNSSLPFSLRRTAAEKRYGVTPNGGRNCHGCLHQLCCLLAHFQRLRKTMDDRKESNPKQPLAGADAMVESSEQLVKTAVLEHRKREQIKNMAMPGLWNQDELYE